MSIVGGMEDLATRTINSYIDEFFSMGIGEKINNPNEKILFSGNIYISRRSLKHIVEQRSINDRLSIKEIKSLARDVRMMLATSKIVITSDNGKYPNSYIYGGFDIEINRGVISVIDCADREERFIITMFYKEAKQFLKLLKKNSP